MKSTLENPLPAISPSFSVTTYAGEIVFWEIEARPLRIAGKKAPIPRQNMGSEF